MNVNPQQDLVITASVRSQKLLDRIPHLAWLMTDRGQMVAVNQHWCEYTGQCYLSDAKWDRGHAGPIANIDEAASVMGAEPSYRNFEDNLQLADRDRFTVGWEEAKRWQTPLKIKLQFKGIAEWEWFELELDLDGDELGTIWICTATRLGTELTVPVQQSTDRTRGELGAVALIQDVTADKQAMTDRHHDRSYSQRLATALQVAKVGAWEWNIHTNQIFWTPEFEALFDYEPGTTAQIYAEWLARIHPDDRQRVETTVKATINRQVPEYRCEYRIVVRDGQIRWLDAIGELRTNEAGEPQMSGLIYDITERKQAEIDLQVSEELFRHTFEYTSVGFCHVALDGTWLRVNHKLCEIVGYSEAELLATTFQAITEPTDLAEDLALVEKLIAGEIREYNLEKRYIHKQGHHVWVNLTVSLIRERDLDGRLGAPRHFISAIQDITERKQLEFLTQSQTADLQQLNYSLLLAQQQLKDRNQELNAFVYTVSHDLKAPLRSISNLSTWIEEDLQDRLQESERSQFALLRQRVQRMDALISGLLQYSRVGTQELEIELVDIHKLVIETIDSLDPPASLTIEIGSPLPTLATKRILLTQIFANLLSNAIEHHDRTDGRIEVGVQDLGDFYQFSIADDGPGIPNGEDRLRIFDMFRTLKPSMSTKNTGIGLALVKKIVEGEGGRIWVADDAASAPLPGACFYFTWPK
ncbi:PAS domain S-box protein [Chamaesiphon sp. GL140_3_metabinner_50]|uniref:sensor histidine kinase n=1 Tax=Chamaesiphon sp. GL140_3_metabinner_50 TaxID=2970812 RepID=UPI0025E505F2|nr:PAS domain S-box protein [Chamaesiphon sp. GL140_3_metabinner_50]